VILLACLASGLAASLVVAQVLGIEVPIGRRRDRRRRRSSEFLQQAGVDLSPWQFWSGSAIAAVMAWAAVAAISGSWLVAIVPAAAVGLAPRAFYAKRRMQRLRALQAAWPDALRDVIASITAGRALTQALEDVATHGPPVIREYLGRLPFLVRMLGTVPALEVVKEELADPTSDRIFEVLILAHERGGAIVPAILEDLVAAVTDDVKLLDEIETAGLEMRINSRAVLALPWAVLVLLTAVQDSFRAFYSTTAGAFVIVVALAASAFGHSMLQRLQRVATEPRVFAAGAVRR
jgi:tight adherence protein B